MAKVVPVPSTLTLTVNANGLIRAVAAGSTSLTASYQGQTDSQTITVIEQPALLTHRYSFTENASDSVGGANGTLQGSAQISAGKLVLDQSNDRGSRPMAIFWHLLALGSMSFRDS
jgi:hypothetical protein